jgi:hypothetical protein
MRVRLADSVGDFGGDKDIARDLRERVLEPAMVSDTSVVLDFSGVELVTQSFIHALISDLVRSTDYDALALLDFHGCNQSVRELIEIVVEYSQEDVTEPLDPPRADPASS